MPKTISQWLRKVKRQDSRTNDASPVDKNLPTNDNNDLNNNHLPVINNSPNDVNVATDAILNPRTFSVVNNSHGQSQSPFFHILPLEIRFRIYEFLFGYHTIHLEYQEDDRYEGNTLTPDKRNRGKWWYCICDQDSVLDLPKDVCCSQQTRSLYNFKSQLKHGETVANRGISPAMLWTCQRVYSEAIHILYSTNTFRLLSDQMFRRLPDLLHPPRFNSITSLDIDWKLSPKEEPTFSESSKESYDEFWRLLTVMPNLKRLFVAIRVLPYDFRGPNVKEAEETWLTPMEQLTELERFILMLPVSYFQAFERCGGGGDREGRGEQTPFWRKVEKLDGRMEWLFAICDFR